MIVRFGLRRAVFQSAPSLFSLSKRLGPTLKMAELSASDRLRFFHRVLARRSVPVRRVSPAHSSPARAHQRVGLLLSGEATREGGLQT
jgi:hypothetical protein